MIPPFDIWAPMFRAPFSGDVTQEIVPRFMSPDIAGVPDLEHRIHCEVASYGTQLDKILEALDTLSQTTKTPLPEIEALSAKIAHAKAESVNTYRDEATSALTRLKARDPAAWAQVLADAARDDGAPNA